VRDPLDRPGITGIEGRAKVVQLLGRVGEEFRDDLFQQVVVGAAHRAQLVEHGVIENHIPPIMEPSMRALVAEDDPVAATILSRALRTWHIETVVVHDGTAAWELITAGAAPPLAILDWMMPGVDGPELCRRIRQHQTCAGMYVLLLTSRDRTEDIVAGLDAGADDYLVKPFRAAELRARINVGVRVLTLQERLAQRVAELQDALANVKQLNGLLPMCAYCKRIRNDENYWQQVESYIADRTQAEFSHGICPACLEKVRADFERD
jgi:phosphoserine phosphatase RsbU/P